jgi:hypothetical protein
MRATQASSPPPSLPIEAHKRSTWIIVWLALASVVAVAALVFGLLAYFHSTATTASGSPTVGVPTIVSSQDLAAYAKTTGPIYWAGAQKSKQYELTVTADGDTYVRYLPAGVKAGSTSAKYLTVATYPVANAYALLVAKGKDDGETATTTQSGAVILSSDSDKSRAYFAFPNSNFQVEVFDPQSGEALSKVSNGSLVVVK